MQNADEYSVGGETHAIVEKSAQDAFVDRHVGLRIRARRLQVGLTQAEIGEELGISFQQVQKYERGTNRVSASKLFAIARCLRTNVAYYFEGLQGLTVDQDSLFEFERCLSFLAMTEGAELAKRFVGLPPLLRRAILDLLRELHQRQYDCETTRMNEAEGTGVYRT